ncbi:MAG: V-type ATPase subunit subunit G family protein [Candidatus Hodarchaeales archaeon]
MAGDLLHLIREAEKNAKNEINEAEAKAQEIIKEAESKAKQMLSEVESFDNLDAGELDAKVQKQITKLLDQIEKETNAIKTNAKNKFESGVQYAIKSLLELE